MSFPARTLWADPAPLETIPVETPPMDIGPRVSYGRPILEAEGLRIGIAGRNPTILVHDVGFALHPGRTLALVGESGSGKSLTALSLPRLLPEPSVTLLGGTIRFDGEDVMGLSPARLRAVRGGGIGMIFQEPLSALSPVMRVGHQIREAVTAHENLTGAAANRRVIELLELVRMPDAARRAQDYPHRLSGGMRQRVLIAMAMAGRPKILIADEPTTALDVTVQAEIMDMLRGLQETFKLALLLITHDFGLVADYADDVAVLYAGRVVERGPAARVLADPLHPYTRGLLGARPHATRSKAARLRLAEIPGSVPRPGELPAGCAFEARCPMAVADCRTRRPEMMYPRPDQGAACPRAGETP
jgi:oligopeptide/dipeptide ABC transporter ATP-binding protein